MRLQDALGKIQGTAGFSSLMHGALSGDADNLSRQSPVGASLAEAESKLASVRKAQSECRSDYAFWGYEGEAAAWEAAVNLLKAADIVGPDSLPDVEFRPGGGVVMDECAKLHKWSKFVLDRAEAIGRDEDLRQSLST